MPHTFITDPLIKFWESSRAVIVKEMPKAHSTVKHIEGKSRKTFKLNRLERKQCNKARSERIIIILREKK